jgi:creatinine amidohydrolase
MSSARVAATLADDSRLIVPVGTCAQFHPALPMGCATIIVERLADDLSAEFGVLRAPTMEYGVNPDNGTNSGQVSLRKKTLHRTLNDMLASWETHGATEFVVLTAHGYDPHLEALATVTTVSARIRAVDIFAVNLSDLCAYPITNDRGGLYVALLFHLAPELVDATALPPEYPLEDGAAIYERIRTRIGERIFLAPVPTE